MYKLSFYFGSEWYTAGIRVLLYTEVSFFFNSSRSVRVAVVLRSWREVGSPERSLTTHEGINILLWFWFVGGNKILPVVEVSDR